MRTDIAILLGLLAVALLSMPVFALVRGGRQDPLEKKERGSFILGTFVREWFYWFLGPVEKPAVALGLSPLAFNILGVGFGIAAGAFFAFGHLVLGGWGVLLGGIADILDGRIARARDMASRRGAFLDSTLDRFAEVGAFVGLAGYYQDAGLPGVLVAAALGGSLLVSYARARGESVDVLCAKGVLQRAERLLLLGFGGILDPAATAALGLKEGTVLLGVVATIAVGTVGTAVYRTVWIAGRLPATEE